MPHEILKLKSVHATDGYSHVAKVGNTLYISGQVARDIGGNLVGRGDIDAQLRQVYTNLKNIMEEYGGGMANIAKLTTLLTHHAFREANVRIRKEFFAEPMPGNTLIVVESLASPDFLVEIEAIAVID
jgi:enamine deaminase RidA (YjgF/YER057c/UK114 family)